MVDISHETPSQTAVRLRSVLAAADIEVLPGEWSYHVESRGAPVQLDEDTLAAVGDRDGWSLLRASRGDDLERFAVFAVHFPAGVDNSGFVGWLASELKARLGAGVAVICGYNPRRGGVFDYWLVPEQVRDDALAVVHALAADR